MDPNQTQDQTNINPNPAPQAPSATPPQPQAGQPLAETGGTLPPPGSLPGQGPGQSAPKSNGKIILFIGIGILLLIVLGVIYFMAAQLGNQYKKDAITPTPTQAEPTSTPTPTPLSEEDINTIDLGDPEADLKSIDEDVKQL